MAWFEQLTGLVWHFLRSLGVWEYVGYTGQAMFFSRFIIQWIASERQRQSVIPVAFWYLSLVGSAIVLAYAIHRRDPVFIPAFSLNMIIYLRNLYFIHFKPAEAREKGAAPPPTGK